MQLAKKGLYVVTTAGTARALSSTSLKVFKLSITPTPGQTGKVFIGGSDLVGSTLSTVARALWPDASGGLPDKWELESPDGKNSIDLSQIFVDVAVSGEGPLLEAWRM